MFEHLRKPVAAMALGIAGFVGAAHAAPFSTVVFLGDSLSDTGNVLSLTTAFTPTPFPNYSGAPGRFSDGPVWTEYLAAGLGFPGSSEPANLLFNGTAVIPVGPPGGQNYAYGGARTGLGGAAGATTGLIGQLINWNGNVFAGSLTRAADPGALYVVMAGANDLRDARTANPGGTPADSAARAAAAAATATNVVNVVGLLAQAGARHFLVSNVPDLGRTPEAVALGVVDASTDVSNRFNTALDLAVDAFDALFLSLTQVDLDIRSLDFAGLTDAIFLDASTNGGALFGITNIATPCIEPVAPGAYYFPGSTDRDGNCSVSAFSDPLHPSAAVHRLVGGAALAAVPEPASWLLVAAALAAALWRRRPLAALT
jgi:outer membrane lipase/esterase